jgi:hypothetical protein
MQFHVNGKVMVRDFTYVTKVKEALLVNWKFLMLGGGRVL